MTLLVVSVYVNAVMVEVEVIVIILMLYFCSNVYQDAFVINLIARAAGFAIAISSFYYDSGKKYVTDSLTWSRWL